MRLIDADALLEQMQPVSTFKINSYADAAAMTIANAYIKLVENQPTVDTTTHDSIPAETGENDGVGTSGDCISRQVAIDALLGITAMRNTIPLDSAIFNIKKLPSAQPNHCAEVGKKVLIDRQAAIEHWRRIIDATSTDSGYNMGFVDGLEFCISHLSTMPSVQPERKEHGCEYCHEDSDGYVLSVEKNGHAYIQNGKLALRANGWRGECAIKFCPMCGRKLGGGKANE